MSSTRNIKQIKNYEPETDFQPFWEEYAIKHSENERPSRTTQFFASIPKSLANDFFSSTRRVIQFGVCGSSFLGNVKRTTQRECIGYDYAKNAILCAEKEGLETRFIDLNDINEAGQLRYQGILVTDMSLAVDIIAVCTFEYLNPKALILLLDMLINNVKPNSRLYIKDYRANGLTVGNSLQHGYVASFFAPRIDFQFHRHAALEANDGSNGSISHFAVSKRS